MDNFEFDKEMREELAEIGIEKGGYYEVSVEPERAAVVAAFYDYYCDIAGFDDEMSIENILTVPAAEPVDEGGNNEELLARLDMYLQDLVDAHPILTGGIVKVRGEGLFVHPEDEVYDIGDDDTEQILPISFLKGGSLVGEVGVYGVSPTIPYESFLAAQQPSSGYVDEQYVGESELPGVWVSINNVTVFSASGDAVARHDHVLVPFNYPSLFFSKPEWQSTVPEKNQITKPPIETISYFNGNPITEAYTQITDDLNQFDGSVEDLHVLREGCQAEIEARMAHIDTQKPYTISATEAWTVSSMPIQLNEEIALYVKPFVLQVAEEWCIMHGFAVKAGDEEIFVYIDPQSLTTIHEIYEP